MVSSSINKNIQGQAAQNHLMYKNYQQQIQNVQPKAQFTSTNKIPSKKKQAAAKGNYQTNPQKLPQYNFSGT